MTTILRTVFNFFQLNCCFILLIILGITKITAQPLNNHLMFDGNDDYISLNNMDVSGSAITLEALINSSDLSNCQLRDCRIISKAIGLSTPDHYWMLSTNNSGANTVLRFRLKTNGTSTTLVATSGPLSENTWYHVAATYDGSIMRLFLDGVEVGNAAKTGTLTTNPAVEAFIGANPPGAENPWQGAIDEVRIWNTARTQAQIQANSSSELTGNEAGLQAYYQFNEGSGQTINDQAGNNNTVLGSTSSADTNDPIFANSNPPNPIDLKVLLEGSYDPSANELTNTLETRNLIPNNQPFNTAPWYYNGNETKVIAQVSDWVLVSFRTEIDGNSEIGRAAGLLQSDGQIHFPSTNVLPSSLNTPVYVVIETRNHLTIMSPQPVAVNNGMLTYDFTLADSYTGGGRGQKQMSNGKWSMFSGDINNDLDINGADRVLWAAANGSFGAYLQEDLNLDGDVTGNDRIYWDLNNGVFSTVPKSDTLRTIAVLTCPAPNFILDNCNYTINWIHDNPLSTTVNYDLRINGIDPGPSVVYPVTSNTVDICNTLGINSGTGTMDLELLYWYDGDVTNQISAGTCTVGYDFGSTPSHNLGKTFAQIEADTDLPKFCSMDGDDAYVAEYLYQNPGVCYWNVVTLPNGEKCVVPVDVPTVPANAIQLPAPSGGNDTQALESVLNGNGTNKTFVGSGSYKVNQLDLNRAGTVIHNMPVTPASGAGELIHINASDIRLINCPQDLKNQGSAFLGVRAENADRFHLIRSGTTNMFHTGGGSGGGVRIRDCADFHIAGGIYKDILNPKDTPGSQVSQVCRANMFWIAGGAVTDGGYIVNNIGENFQSTGRPTNGNEDAEFLTIQGNGGHLKQVKVFANRCVDVGKRLLKSQADGGATILSNSYEWRTNSSVLGNRKRLAIIDVHFKTGDVIVRNNRLAINGNDNWGYVMNIQSTNKSGTNIHFDCNSIEINNPWNGAGYDQCILSARSFNAGSIGTDSSQESTNCSMNDNTIFGTGEVNYNYWFGRGYDVNSGPLQPTGNTFNLGPGSPRQGFERK